MKIPKNYFHNRQVLFLVCTNFILTALTIATVLFRLTTNNNDGIVSQYHANLGLSAYTPGSVASILGFVVFTIVILLFNTAISMRMYHKRREFSIVVLWTTLLLLLLSLAVSYSLVVL